MTTLINALDLYRSRVGSLIGDIFCLLCMCSYELSDFSDYRCSTKNDFFCCNKYVALQKFDLIQNQGSICNEEHMGPVKYYDNMRNIKASQQFLEPSVPLP